MTGRAHTPSGDPVEVADDVELSLIQQVFDIWINPDVQRRVVNGTRSAAEGIFAAQVVLPSPLDGKRPEVRLNHEIRAVAHVELRSPRQLRAGDAVAGTDIQRVKAIARLSEEDPNAGLITLLLLGDQWDMHFDLRRDLARAHGLVDRAMEFALAARAGYEIGQTSPAYDNLFSAAELSARSLLLLSVTFPYQNPKDHGAIASQYKRWASAGNIPKRHSDALEVLRKVRSTVRYMEGHQKLPPFELTFWTVAEAIAHSRRQLALDSSEN